MLSWKIGVEAELLAPRGSSRRALAERLAAACEGTVTPFFHPQSEPSLVPDVPVFDNLTLGFEVRDHAGALVARCVDDLTLQDDLDRSAPPRSGWFRVVSDEMRLLHLVKRHGRADQGPLEAVAPVAALFGTEPEVFPDGIVRVTDETAAPVVIGMPLPSERERPCEVVSAPLDADHARRLAALLLPAREMGFGLARESATHVHFDAAPLASARVVVQLVRLLETWGPALKALVGTNPACRRLGVWPEALFETVEEPAFVELPWAEARARLQGASLSKYCDFNLKNLVYDVPGKHTFEVRVLPGMSDPEPILLGAALFEGVLRRAASGAPVARAKPKRVSPKALASLLDDLPLAPEVRSHWQRRASRV